MIKHAFNSPADFGVVGATVTGIADVMSLTDGNRVTGTGGNRITTPPHNV